MWWKIQDFLWIFFILFWGNVWKFWMNDAWITIYNVQICCFFGVECMDLPNQFYSFETRVITMIYSFLIYLFKLSFNFLLGRRPSSFLSFFLLFGSNSHEYNHLSWKYHFIIVIYIKAHYMKVVRIYKG